jgi:hypothetical protein
MTERKQAVESIKPALEQWLCALPAEIRTAYIEKGVLADTSDTNEWRACSRNLQTTLTQLIDLTVRAVQDAIGQRDPASRKTWQRTKTRPTLQENIMGPRGRPTCTDGVLI